MKNYLVRVEDHGFTYDVRVKANSIEEAVATAERDHCEPRQVTINPKPTWAEPLPEDPDKEIYELSHEVFDRCADCQLVIFNHGGEISKKWPWSYTSGDKGDSTNICYPCAMKRKEAGNYCAAFDTYYRDDHHYGCSKCPINDCVVAKERHYEKLEKNLRRAFSYSKAKPDEFNQFLENNEYELAYKMLAAAGPAEDSTFNSFMEGIKTLLALPIKPARGF